MVRKGRRNGLGTGNRLGNALIHVFEQRGGSFPVEIGPKLTENDEFLFFWLEGGISNQNLSLDEEEK